MAPVGNDALDMTRRSTLAAVVATLAAAALLGGGVPTDSPARAATTDQGVADAGQPTRVGGKRGFGRVHRRLQPLPQSLQQRLEESFRTVNPSAPEPPPPSPPPAPRGAGIADAALDPPLDALRRADPPNGVPAPDPRSLRPRTSSAADDFELFRSQPVAQGAGITGTVAEPTVANDRNGLLYTGNFHAALSDDNGLSWSYLNPATQFAAIKGGFCCDQVAYAVDRGGSSLVFWLLQYRDDGVTGGALRLVVYEGRQELLEQANYCEHVITPATINEAGVKWFDFNVMSSTDEHLFISSKVFDSATGAHVTGAVIRWELADFEDGDCSLDSGLVYKNADGPAQNTALAQGADSTMYWGKRTGNGQIDVWELPDSATTATRRTKTVSTWAASGRGQSHCPVPDGTDPCARANDKLNVAFLHEGKLAFAWNVAEGNGFPFPHIRLARFDLGTLNLADEPDIWHPDYAWTYAAAGVGAAGHLGLSLYRIGGGSFPRARVALVDDVDTNIDSLNMHGVITSDAGTLDPTGAVVGRWGDYAAVRPYGNCANTFAATVHSQQGGNLNKDSEHRFVWFGRERDGCADLVISDLAFLPTDIRAGESLLVAQTTRNIGSGDAGASTTRVYLSRDAGHSDDDLILDETASHGGLDRGESQGLGIVAEVPEAAAGAYYVIICADDTERVDEVTGTNNCRIAGTVTVRLNVIATGAVRDLSTPQFGAVARGARFSATLRTRRAAGAGARAAGWLGVWLSRTPRRSAKSRLLVARRVASAKPGTIRHRLRLRVPRQLAPGDYHVIACLDRSRRQPNGARCLTGRHQLHVTARPSNAAPFG